MGSAPIVNWVYERDRVTESTLNAAKKARKQEEKLIKEGWRWIKLSARTRILVPCDKNGKPTKEGQKRIDTIKRQIV